MQVRPRVSSSIVRQAYLVHGPTLPLESRFPRRHAHRQTNDVLFVRSRAFFPPPPLLPTCNDKDDVISSMISNSIDCSYRDENDMEEIISLPLTVHSSSSSSGGRNVHFQVVLCVDNWRIFDCLGPSLYYELRSDAGIVSPSSHSVPLSLSNARTTRGG